MLKRARQKRTPAEQWVIEQVKAGYLADLIEKFPDESERKLGAQFLEDLLTKIPPTVKPHRNGVLIRGAIFDHWIDLRNAQIPYEVGLNECRFVQSANFAHASFAGTLSFNGSTFKADANFQGLKVGNFASFNGTVFEAPVSFAFAEIASGFEAEDAHFNERTKPTYFNGMKVGNAALFNRSFFEGPVIFHGIDVGSNFEADHAQFNEKAQKANFNRITVGGSAFFEKAIFEGPVDFAGSNIDGEFEAMDAQFKNKEHRAHFNGMKIGLGVSFIQAIFHGPASFNSIRVGHAAFFDRSIFEGAVDFIGADIASNFEAEEAQFRSKTETVQLQMKCGRKGYFMRATFAGPVSFEDSSFLDLMLGGMSADAPPAPQINLSRSSIKRQLAITQIRVRDLIAPSLHVEGPAEFTGIAVEHSADLSYTGFAKLDLSRSTWPTNGSSDGGSFQLEGMNYKYVRADAHGSQSNDALLKLIDQSAFSADVYRTLEAFFLRQGYRAHADEAFIAGKRRERKEHLISLHSFGSLVLDLLVGYGRRTWQIGIPCALLVGFGVALFSPNKMEPQKIDATPRIYNRFWYSLGLFLPIVNLESDKVWKPKPEQIFLRNYMRVHILLGWILIPILLAALSGLIK